MKSGGFDAPTGSLQFYSQRLMTLRRPKTSRCARATHRCLSALTLCAPAPTLCAPAQTLCASALTLCASALTLFAPATTRCVRTTKRCPRAPTLCASATVRCAVWQERARRGRSYASVFSSRRCILTRFLKKPREPAARMAALQGCVVSSRFTLSLPPSPPYLIFHKI